MSKNRNRLETRAALIVPAVGALLVVIVGVPMYMSAAAAPLRPHPERTPSVMRAAPLQRSIAADCCSRRRRNTPDVRCR